MARRDPYLDKQGRHPLGIVAARLPIMLAFVFLTWNPSGYSAVSYALSTFRSDPTLAAAIAGVLALCWLAAGYAVRRWINIGFAVGVCIVVVVICFLIMRVSSVSADAGAAAMVWAALAAIALMLTFAVSGKDFANLRRRLER